MLDSVSWGTLRPTKEIPIENAPQLQPLGKQGGFKGQQPCLSHLSVLCT